MPANDVLLYAQWQINKFKIHFEANGGTGTMGDEEYTYGESKQLFKDEFVRDGYTFKGWSTTSTGKVDYADEAMYTYSQVADTTLYAQWEPRPIPPNTRP